MKKFLLMALAMVTVAALAITGTIAYLTWEDSDVNVMTTSNVSIEQNEQDRYGNDFVQGQPLLPYVTLGTTEKETVTVNGYEIQMRTKESVGNYMDKIVTVTNTGKTDAYVRTLIAIPAALENEDTSKNIIHWNVISDSDTNPNNGWMWDIDNEKEWGAPVYATIEIEGVKYNVYVATNKNVIKAGESTAPSLVGIYLDSKVDFDGDKYTYDGQPIDYDFSNGVAILVMSQAVQAGGFANAKTALDTGFGKVADKAEEWFGGVIAEHSMDAWDGTADDTWYNETDTEFVITTAEQLAGLAKLVDGGNTFAGKTVKLGRDLDLYLMGENGEPVSFDPIGDKSAFAGTFDGQGYTISNLYQSGWAFGYEWGSYGSLGLFGELESATVKNLTISGAESLVEGGDVGGITGSATGDCVFENITLKDSVFATYNNGNGGIIGWSGAGNYTFKNITIAEDVVLAGLWGSFDSSIGGVVGQGEPGATYNFENVDIACRLDVYNDCTASYDYYNYRMCGMIIGRLAKTTTIDGSNYPDMSQYNITCNNVTVTYGDWANYHYCEPTPANMNGGRGMRVESGYSYDGLPADYDHSQCVDNHMTLIEFDQIFGGDQLGVKGLKTYDGVNVVYNNK